MYEGVPCNNNSTQCCYNEKLWCPSEDNCKADNGAYPFGDQRQFNSEMTDPYALTPFPNAIMFNWATIFVLAFGNLAGKIRENIQTLCRIFVLFLLSTDILSALDFQARCMASKTPRVATISCVIAGCLTFAVGIPYAYLGAITRVHYGPDSGNKKMCLFSVALTQRPNSSIYFCNSSSRIWDRFMSRYSWVADLRALASRCRCVCKAPRQWSSYFSRRVVCSRNRCSINVKWVSGVWIVNIDMNEIECLMTFLWT